MSSYGYYQPVCPCFDSLKSKPNVIFKQGISAGISMDVSLPMFFNIAIKPDSSEQIDSGNRNLFKMAKMTLNGSAILSRKCQIKNVKQKV